MCCELMFPSAANIRLTNDVSGISSEKITTGKFGSATATFWAIFKTNAVLPTAGRAATIIISPPWNPVVRLSSAGYPEASPVTVSVVREFCSICSNDFSTTSAIFLKSALFSPPLIISSFVDSSATASSTESAPS